MTGARLLLISRTASTGFATSWLGSSAAGSASIRRSASNSTMRTRSSASVIFSGSNRHLYDFHVSHLYHASEWQHVPKPGRHVSSELRLYGSVLHHRKCLQSHNATQCPKLERLIDPDDSLIASGPCLYWVDERGP